jgi:hypothetical protein
MREADIEKYVKQHVKGHLVKWVAPGESGVPDRILLLPNGRVIFIEFKMESGKLSPRQRLWIKRLTDLGHDVRVIIGMDMAKRFVEEVMG